MLVHFNALHLKDPLGAHALIVIEQQQFDNRDHCRFESPDALASERFKFLIELVDG